MSIEGFNLNIQHVLVAFLSLAGLAARKQTHAWPKTV